jgi:hypothetical protein
MEQIHQHRAWQAGTDASTKSLGGNMSKEEGDGSGPSGSVRRLSPERQKRKKETEKSE